MTTGISRKLTRNADMILEVMLTMLDSLSLENSQFIPNRGPYYCLCALAKGGKADSCHLLCECGQVVALDKYLRLLGTSMTSFLVASTGTLMMLR